MGDRVGARRDGSFPGQPRPPNEVEPMRVVRMEPDLLPGHPRFVVQHWRPLYVSVLDGAYFLPERPRLETFVDLKAP